MKTKTIVSAFALCVAALPVMAQSSSGMVQRDINQQQRISDGLKSGQLTTHEAARIEHDQARVDRTQAKAMKDGTLSQTEKDKISKMQNKVSREIHEEKHDGQTGNPNSASSRRMQESVQRDINQKKRIENGIQNGSLNNREVGRLERGQAKAERAQYRAGRDGHVGPHEARHLNRIENQKSRRIHHEKHDHHYRG